MAPKSFLKNHIPSPCGKMAKVIFNVNEKNKFLLKLKEKVKRKKINNKMVAKRISQAKKTIEVITLDDDESEMEICETAVPAVNVTNKAPKESRPETKSSSSSSSSKVHRRGLATPFLSLAEFNKRYQSLSQLVHLNRQILFGSSDSLGNPSNDSSISDQAEMELEEGELNPGIDDEISIIETENDDELSVSFYEKKNSVHNEADDVAIVEHIQYDVNCRLSKDIQKIGHAIVYVDGSCREFYRTGEMIAGIGVYWSENDKRNVSELIKGPASANRAEIQAAIRAITTAIEFKYEYVTVFTDSMYLIEGIKRYWRRQMGNQERCRPDFAELAPLLNKIKVILKKVPAHKGIRGNEFADELATQATRKGIQEMYQRQNRSRRY